MDQNWAPCWLPLRCSGCRYNLLVQWTYSHLRDIFLLWLRYAIGAWRIPDKKAWILLELLGHNIPEGISTDFEPFLFPHGTVWCITGVYLCKLWYQYLLIIFIVLWNHWYYSCAFCKFLKYFHVCFFRDCQVVTWGILKWGCTMYTSLHSFWVLWNHPMEIIHNYLPQRDFQLCMLGPSWLSRYNYWRSYTFNCCRDAPLGASWALCRITHWWNRRYVCPHLKNIKSFTRFLCALISGIMVY